MVIASATAQIDVEGKIRSKSYDRADQRTDEGVDKGLDKLEEGVVSVFKKKKKEKAEDSQESEEEMESQEQEEGESEESAAKPKQTTPKQKLEAKTQYDFVPGDKILYFEDFSQDAIGDFPALWTTNGSAEVKTVNIASGNWFHMNGQDAMYCYTKPIGFPPNFIMEFDIIPDENYEHGLQLSFYGDTEEKEFTDDLYPGEKGVHIFLTNEGWETLGYNNITNGDWLTGQSETNPVVKEQVNHVIVWIQNRRVRIYHQGSKVLDMPTNIYADTKFNRFRFSGYDRYVSPYVSNIKITTASPDTRSKLITEGKLVSYGIYFDSGKDVVKPESYGAIKEIAAVLKENPSVKIKIVGHTDSDGDDAKNLDLSKRRAASVKSYLVSQFQANGSNIETDGKGEGAPMESNNTSEGKAKNRRVEFLKL
jgi:outer membrane protein OmpA-like peptidoglycan-associated protein